jgi:hypothetical protein
MSTSPSRTNIANVRIGRLAGHLRRRDPAASPAASPAARPTARIAVVGLGWWTTAHHIPDLEANPAATLAAAVDIEPGRRAAVAEQHGVPTFGSVEEMFASGLALDGASACSSARRPALLLCSLVPRSCRVGLRRC